jgi:uncharacterized membrane protein
LLCSEAARYTFPAMSTAKRWGKGILGAGGCVLGVYLMHRYVFTRPFDSDFAVYYFVFVAFLLGWLDGTRQINGKRSKKTISLKRIISRTYTVAGRCALAYYRSWRH